MTVTANMRGHKEKASPLTACTQHEKLNVPICVLSSIQAVDVEAVAVTVKELVSYALTLNPNNQSWLITQADIYFGKNNHHISSTQRTFFTESVKCCYSLDKG